MDTIQNTILKLLQKEALKPGMLAEKLGISRQALHKYLRLLLEEKRIQKRGSGPHVSYHIPSPAHASNIQSAYETCRKELLPRYLDQCSVPLGIYTKKFFKKNSTHSKGTFNFGFLLESAAVYSSNIEGNSLNLSAFLNSRMQQKKHRPREAQEIEDLVKAYRYAQEHSLSQANMLHAHAILSRQFLNASRQGIYREEPVGVFSALGLVYMAVEPLHVQTEMAELFRVIDALVQKKHTAAESFFWASWLHLMMVLVHPFSDGNGRISRLCEKWFLAQTSGKDCFFLPIEEQYWNHRPQYYRALKLGAHYWETDMRNAFPFFALLPEALLHSHYA